MIPVGTAGATESFLHFTDTLQSRLNARGSRDSSGTPWRCVRMHADRAGEVSEEAVAIVVLATDMPWELEDARVVLFNHAVRHPGTAFLVVPIKDSEQPPRGLNIFRPAYAPHGVIVDRDPEMSSLCAAIRVAAERGNSIRP